MLPAILLLGLGPPPPAAAQSDSPPALLDLNSANAEQLDGLPGIGPVRAQAIVRIRERNGPFRSIDELRALPRLSEKAFARLRGLVTVVRRPCTPDSEPSHNSNGAKPVQP